MLERGEHPRLTLEAGLKLGAVGKLRVDDLQRDLAGEAWVEREVHARHAALADALQQLIAPDGAACVECHRALPPRTGSAWPHCSTNAATGRDAVLRFGEGSVWGLLRWLLRGVEV